MNRYAARIFSALALGAFALLPLAARAAGTDFVFAGRHIHFERFVDQQGGRAVAVDDSGLRAFLGQAAATIAWQPGQRYILVTTAQPLIVNFALGDRQYDAGPVTETAPFAPFLLDGRAYVPFDELVHAIGFSVKSDGAQQVLQPQLTALDVQGSDTGVKIVAHGGMPLDAKVTSAGAGKTVVTFADTASALPPSRTVDGGTVRRIDARTEGTVQHPRAVITIYSNASAGRPQPGTDDQRDFTLAFGGQQTDAQQQQQQINAPPQQAGGQTQQIHVTSVQTGSESGSTTVRIAIDGPASYEWHRLRAPDNRVWVDIHNARLGMAPQDAPVRVHQQSPDTVRVALTLPDFQTVDVEPDQSGITLTAGPQLADEGMPRSGSGTAGTPSAAAIAQTTPAPDDTWKFSPKPTPSAPAYIAANPRLIVIDPGHGGSDPGSIRGQYVEKNLTLDMAKRLRDILVKRGWQVMMTHDDDRDVAAHAESDGDELQARDDVANTNGARLFVSIHVNSFINSGPHGATVYFYKPEDYSLAQALNHRIAAHVAVKSDGIVKDKLYVLHHADCPAALVETAFISNPDDRALLASAQWRQSMAQAIADGLGDYAGPAPAQSGPGQ